MKITELTPCIVCNKSPLPLFHVIDVQIATQTAALGQTIGIAQTWGGPLDLGKLKLAELFAPHPEKAIIIAGEENPDLKTRLIVCQSCYMEHFSKLAVYAKKATQIKEKFIRDKIAEEIAQEGDPE